MIFVVENGSIVTGANTYVTPKEARVYAADRGYADKFEDDDKVKEALVLAMDYLNSISDYKGIIADTLQNLPWPRRGVITNGFAFPVDSIPQSLKVAQIELAIAVRQGINLFPNRGFALAESGQVKKEKVGPLETEYFEKGTEFFQRIKLPYIDLLLKDLIVRTPVLRTIRV